MHSGTPLNAQTFWPVNGPVLTREVRFNEANECYLYFQNPSGDSLHLRWRRLEVGKPEEWTVDLCDYGTCYIGIPSNGLMNIISDSTRPYLKLIVQPGIRAGAAWFWFRVFERYNDSNFQDVYFNLYTPGTTGAGIPGEEDILKLSPNPVRDVLFISNSKPFETPARLYHSNGRLLWRGTLPPESMTTIPVADWPYGFCFLQAGNRTYKVCIQP